MEKKQKLTHPEIKVSEEIFQVIKNRILLYSNLYIPDYIIYDLAKEIEEFYEEDHS